MKKFLSLFILCVLFTAGPVYADTVVVGGGGSAIP